MSNQEMQMIPSDSFKGINFRISELLIYANPK